MCGAFRPQASLLFIPLLPSLVLPPLFLWSPMGPRPASQSAVCAERRRRAAGVGSRRAPVPRAPGVQQGADGVRSSRGPAPGREDPAAARGARGAAGPAPAGLKGGSRLGRAPALFLPRRLPYLSGERRCAASPPPARPSCPAAAAPPPPLE